MRFLDKALTFAAVGIPTIVGPLREKDLKYSESKERSAELLRLVLATMADRVLRLADGRIVESRANPHKQPATSLSW